MLVLSLVLALGLVLIPGSWAGYSSSVLSDSPRGYWRLGEASGTTAVDQTANANNGTYVGPTLGAPGVLDDGNTAVSLDGTDDYVTIPTSTSLNVTAGITLEAWVKPTAGGFGSAKPLIVKGFTSHVAPFYQYSLLLSDTTANPKMIQFNLSIGGTRQLLTVNNSGWEYGVWNHIAATYDGANMRAYHDAIEVGSRAQTGAISTYGDPLTLGCFDNLAKTSANCLPGVIDEPAVYPNALSATRVRAHYELGFSPALSYRNTALADPARVYWRLGEASGTTASDETANANNGTYTGGPTLGAAAAITGGNTAVSFDGTNDYITAPSAATLNPTTGISLEAWVKPTAGGFGSVKPLIVKGFTSHVAPFYQYSLLLSDTGANPKMIQFNLSIGGTRQILTVNNSGWQNGVWSHIVATYDRTTMRLYRNGKEIGNRAQTGNIATYGDPLTVGCFDNLAKNSTNCLPGVVDEVAVYGAAMSAARVHAHYNTGLAPPPLNAALPAITGQPKQASTLSASTGSWDYLPTSFSYQWRRCDVAGQGCNDIAGQTQANYTPVLADIGSTIRIVVTAANAIGSTSATSNATSVVEGPLPGNSIGYGYDELGRLVTVIDPLAPSNGVAKYNYDEVGNITSIERLSSSGVSVVQLAPARGAVGAKVTIYGTGFATVPGQNTVTFAGGVNATVALATKSQLQVTVPAGATTGSVSVTTPTGSASSASSFTVMPAPQPPSISGFSPAIAAPGTSITVSGSNFAGSVADNVAAIGQSRGNISTASASSISFPVPPGATAGRVLVATPNGSATSASDLFVPPSGYTVASIANTGRMSIGELNRSVSFTDATKNGLMVFDGNAGQYVFLNVSNGSMLSTLKLYDPFGIELGSAGVGPNGGYIDTIQLPTTGTYTILIDPFSGSGNVTLSLYDAGAPSTGSIAANGQPHAVNGLVVGQKAARTFSGTQGQRVFLKVETQMNSLSVRIRDPLGVIVASTLAGTGVAATTAFIDTTALPTTGTYTVDVDPNGASSGDATITLWDVPADSSGSMTIGGLSSTMTLAVGQNGTRTFSGNTGQALTLTLSSVTIASPNVPFGSANFSAKVTIKNPDGSTLTGPTSFGTSGKTINTTLTANGTHTILIDPVVDAAGNATLALTSGGGGAPAPRAQVDGASTRTGDQPVGMFDSGGGQTGDPGDGRPAPLLRSYDAPSVEEWRPSSTEPSTWFSGRPRSPFEDVAVLQARSGLTAVSGRVLRLDGAPLAGVLVRTPAIRTRTDAMGRFLLVGVRPGHVVLTVDATTANRRRAKYGVYEIGVTAKPGRTTVLPFTIWSPKLDVKHQIRLEYPLREDVVLTTPYLPDLQVRIPAGSEIHDRNGRLVRRLGITPVPLDRSPFPMPGRFPVYFTIQPGAAYVWPHGFEIVYPNKMHADPGERIDFYSYDPQEKGWFVYGKGTVTEDGRQIVFDRGTRPYEITSSGVSIGVAFLVFGVILGWYFDGDPVDLATGTFTFPHTDLVERGKPQITLSRIYRSNDGEDDRAFGIGTSLSYDMGLYQPDAHSFEWADLYFANGSKIRYTRISSGTGYEDMVLEAQTTPSDFFKSRITWNGLAFELRRTDGTVYTFANGGLLQSIRDRFGNQITLKRSAGTLGDITQVLSSSGRWIKLTYGASGVSMAEDQSGRTVSYSYNQGRLSQVTDANAETTEYTYNAGGRMETVKDPRDIVYLTNTYDGNGQVDQQTLANGATYDFDYTLDGSGNVTRTDVTGPGGVMRRVTFNSNGQAVSDARAFGTPREQETTYEYQSGNNLLLAEIDERSRRTEYEYNSAGRLTTVTRLAGTPDAVSTTFTYEPDFQQLESITDPLDHGPTFDYDARGALTKVTDARGKETLIVPNIAGQPITVTSPLGDLVSYGYTLGDKTSITDPLGAPTRLFHDSAGRLTHATDPLGNAVTYGYDATGALTTVTDARGGLTAVERDGNGNITKVTDPKLNETLFTYNDMDWVATRRDPRLKLESYVYDARGNLTKITDRKGQVTTLRYDEQDRLTFAGFGTTGTPENPIFESSVTYTYDNGNRLTEAVDSLSGTNTRSFDELDRLTGETTPEGSITLGYDDADRRETLTVAGQPQVTYSYNDADQLTGLARGTISVAVSYDDASRLASITLANGATESYSYDSASRIRSINYSRGGSIMGDLLYGYDAAGHRTAMGGSYARTALPASVALATYDAANRLSSWAGQALTYDDNGNLTSDGSRTYTWNARDELVALAGAGSASFAYDGFGRRARATVNGNQTRYLHAVDNTVQELNGSGTPVRNFLAGLSVDQFFAITDGGGTQSVLTDALGSTLALTDGTGAVQAEFSYEPFGKASQTGSATTAYQYTGRENDGMGLHFNRWRYLNPTFGRFISEDPLGFGGGDINLYAYVWNAPLDFSDPFGAEAQAGTLNRPFGGALGKVNWGQLGRLGRLGGWAGVGWGVGASARKFYLAATSNGESESGGSSDESEQEVCSPSPGDAGWPEPPSYGGGEGWSWGPASRPSVDQDHLYDPDGGEWRWHPPDQHHPKGHWDYNPHDVWNAPWERIPC